MGKSELQKMFQGRHVATGFLKSAAKHGEALHRPGSDGRALATPLEVKKPEEKRPEPSELWGGQSIPLRGGGMINPLVGRVQQPSPALTPTPAVPLEQKKPVQAVSPIESKTQAPRKSSVLGKKEQKKPPTKRLTQRLNRAAEAYTARRWIFIFSLAAAILVIGGTLGALFWYARPYLPLAAKVFLVIVGSGLGLAIVLALFWAFLHVKKLWREVHKPHTIVNGDKVYVLEKKAEAKRVAAVGEEMPDLPMQSRRKVVEALPEQAISKQVQNAQPKDEPKKSTTTSFFTGKTFAALPSPRQKAEQAKEEATGVLHPAAPPASNEPTQRLAKRAQSSLGSDKEADRSASTAKQVVDPEITIDVLPLPEEVEQGVQPQHHSTNLFLMKEELEEPQKHSVVIARSEEGDGEEPTLDMAKDYAIPADDAFSKRKLFVGISGSGKSNTVGVYVEELGRLDAPLVIGDTEDEYKSLVKGGWLPHGILAGKDVREYCITPANAKQFGDYILERNKQVVLNLQSYKMEEGAQILVNLIAGMRAWEEQFENADRIPSEFILEEAVTWLPQYIKESELYGTKVLDALQGIFFNDMVRKGRKRGLGLTLVCQKLAELDNRAMQADMRLLHRQTELADLARYRQMGITNAETLSLKDGEAFLFTSHVSKKRVQIRLRRSEHEANTPGYKNLLRRQKLQKSLGQEKTGRIFSGSGVSEETGKSGKSILPNIPQEKDEYDVAAAKALSPQQNERVESGRRGIVIMRPAEPLPASSHSSGEKRGETGRENFEHEVVQKVGGESAGRKREELAGEILRLYKSGMKRYTIQSVLKINGHDYPLLRDVCDEYDRRG